MSKQVSSYNEIANGSTIAAGSGWVLKLEDGALNMYKGDALDKSQPVTEELQATVVAQYNKRQATNISIAA